MYELLNVFISSYRVCLNIFILLQILDFNSKIHLLPFLLLSLLNIYRTLFKIILCSALYLKLICTYPHYLHIDTEMFFLIAV